MIKMLKETMHVMKLKSTIIYTTVLVFINIFYVSIK